MEKERGGKRGREEGEGGRGGGREGGREGGGKREGEYMGAKGDDTKCGCECEWVHRVIYGLWGVGMMCVVRMFPFPEPYLLREALSGLPLHHNRGIVWKKKLLKPPSTFVL